MESSGLKVTDVLRGDSSGQSAEGSSRGDLTESPLGLVGVEFLVQHRPERREQYCSYAGHMKVDQDGRWVRVGGVILQSTFTSVYRVVTQKRVLPLSRAA